MCNVTEALGCHFSRHYLLCQWSRFGPVGVVETEINHFFSEIISDFQSKYKDRYLGNSLPIPMGIGITWGYRAAGTRKPISISSQPSNITATDKTTRVM